MLMQRIHLFLILTVLSVASLVAVTVAGYYVLSTATSASQYPSNWMGQMMGGHSATQAQAQNSAAPYFGVAFIVAVSLAIVGIVGLVYFALFPKSKLPTL